MAAGEASKEFEKLSESFAKLSLAQFSQDASNLTAVIEANGGAANLTAAQLEAAGKSIETFEKNGVALNATLQETKDRLDAIEQSKAVDTLVKKVDELGKTDAKVDILVKSLEQLGDVSKLGEKQVEALAKEVIDLGIPVKDLDPALRAVVDRLKEIENSKALKELGDEFRQLSGVVSDEGRQAFENIRIALEGTEEEFGKLSNEAIEAAIQKLDELASKDPGLKDEVAALKDEFDLVTDTAFDFGSTMEDLSNIMTAFGIDGSSALGQLVAGFQQVGAAIPAISSFDKSILGQEGLSRTERFQAAAGGIASGIAGIAQATSSGGAGRSAAGGALAGAAAGGQVAGPIGAGVGAAVGAVVGFFRGRGRDRIRKEVGEAVRADVSEDLALAIKDAAKDAGRTIQQQSLISLGDILSTEGLDAFEGGLAGASASALDLLQGIANGTIPAKEGIEGMGQAFTVLAEEAFTAGQVADAEFINIVKASRELGEDIPEISAFIADQLGLAAQGISSVVGGIQIVDVDDAQAQATIFASAFFATMEEVGLLEAVDAFEPAFNELREQIAQFGGDVNLGGVGRIFEIAGQEEFRPLLEGVQGLDDALQGLSNTGFLTADSFGAFQQQAQTAFEQLTAAGLSPQEALTQMGPLLNNLIQASNEFGFELDANTQSLIGQAEAAGVAFRVEPMQQVADTLVVIAELLGATEDQLAGLGSTAQTTGQQVQSGLVDPMQSLPGVVGNAAEEGARRYEEVWIDGLGNVKRAVEEPFADAPMVAAQAGTETAVAFSGNFAETVAGLDPSKIFIDSEQVAANLAEARDALVSGGTEAAQAFVESLQPEEQVDLINTIFGDDPSAIPGRIQELLDSGQIGEAIQATFAGTGEVLSDSFLEPLTEIGGVFGEVVGGAVDGVNEKIAMTQEGVLGIGEASLEATATIQESFGAAAVGIEEGLGPVSDKIGNEIREVGSETAAAIDSSFDATNKAIELGLGEVAGTFLGEVVPAADAATRATEGIAAAAREAARAAKEIDFPEGAPGGGERSAAIGFSGLLSTDLAFQAHAGEIVNIIPAAEVRNMQARGGSIQSAQEGFGGISFSMGDLSVSIETAGRQGGGDAAPGVGATETGISDEAFAAQLGRVILENIGNVVEDAVREALNEQT